MINKLDYIQGMGFDAIWISPIVENYPNSYHGYHATNWENINTNFGSKQDLIDFVTAAHSRGIWVMVDVVANHVGPVGTDYS
jgi:alpha-amylase